MLGGSFGDTQARILETCGIAFVCGAAALAGLACLDRGVVRPAAWPAIALGVASFSAWAGGIWTTLRLLASWPRVLSEPEKSEASERLLGSLGDIEVFAVRGDARSVTIGSTRAGLDSGEGIVLRERGAT